MSARARTCIALMAAAMALSGCQTTHSINPRDAQALQGETLQQLHGPRPDAFATEGKPIIGLALGGGGLRGYAHIGVLQALEEHGIKPDIVVGTSIGAVIGSAYAAGESPADLWQLALGTDVGGIADWTLSTNGILKGEALARWVNTTVGGRSMEALPVVFGAVASDLSKRAAVLLRHGDVGQAVRASAAIPGVFPRVPYSDGALVDGGITSLVPVRFARALGADFVIAVDVYCAGPQYRGTNIVSTMLELTQAQSCLLAEQEMQEADLLISPKVASGYTNVERSRDAARSIGYEAALAALENASPASSKLLRLEAGARRTNWPKDKVTP